MERQRQTFSHLETIQSKTFLQLEKPYRRSATAPCPRSSVFASPITTHSRHSLRMSHPTHPLAPPFANQSIETTNKPGLTDQPPAGGRSGKTSFHPHVVVPQAMISYLDPTNRDNNNNNNNNNIIDVEGGGATLPACIKEARRRGAGRMKIHSLTLPAFSTTGA